MILKLKGSGDANAILPKLRIAVLHSKISAKDTEGEMIAFEKGEYDVLLNLRCQVMLMLSS